MKNAAGEKCRSSLLVIKVLTRPGGKSRALNSFTEKYEVSTLNPPLALKQLVYTDISCQFHTIFVKRQIDQPYSTLIQYYVAQII